MHSPSEPSLARPAPVVFGGHCGWHHAGTSRHAVLLCSSVGFEALCVRQSWNVLGDMLAARGLHVLRFDYPGEGDGLDRKPGEPLADAAVASIRAAAQWLKETVGAETISVIGLRLGATFALQALHGVAVHRLALLAPVLSGRTYLRELRLTSQVLAELRPGQDAAADEINVCGFLMTALDTAAIGHISMPATIAATHTLLVLEPDRAVPEVFAGADTLTFQGYGRMVAPPTEAVIPFEDFGAIADWMSQDLPADGPALPVGHGAAVLTGEGFRETHLRFGRDGQMAGVLCEPIADTRDVCVHILNAGANYHIGWARMAVEHARALAQDGIASLRYDFSGIGDSVWYPEGARPHIYADRHIDDSGEAIEAMAARGYRKHVLAGLCAGGYVAFHAAQRDARVSGSVVANAIRLVWHPHDRLDDLAKEMLQPAAVYRDKMRSANEWKRLLAGEISAGRILVIAGRMLKKVGVRVLRIGGIEPALSEDNRTVRHILATAAGRGARMTFIHAERDQSRDESERHFGPGMHFARKLPGVAIEDIAGADHELTPRAARTIFLQAMQRLAK